MSSLLQDVCRLSQTIFSTFLSNTSKKSSYLQQELDEATLSPLKKMFSRMTLNDLYFNLNELRDKNRGQDPMTYTSIFENQFFSLTVFGFRHKKSVLPLHDHPGMYGFIKCVHGRISIKSYTLLNNIEVPDEILKKTPKIPPNYLVPSLYRGEQIISSESDQLGIVTPNERNLHEIRPLTNEAVMADILSPPYNETNSYNFYVIVDTVFDSKLKHDVTWLLKRHFTYDYTCDTLKYNGPPIII